MVSSCPALRLHGDRVLPGRHCFACCEAAHSQHEYASLPQFGPDPYLAFVRLNNLVNDRQAQTGATFKLRLEWLEYFLDQLRAHSRTGIGETELPIFAGSFQPYRQSPSLRMARTAFSQKFQKTCFSGLRRPEANASGAPIMSLDSYADLLCFEPVFEQCKRVFEQRNHIYLANVLSGRANRQGNR